MRFIYLMSPCYQVCDINSRRYVTWYICKYIYCMLTGETWFCYIHARSGQYAVVDKQDLVQRKWTERGP